jgi:hypothetical protein
MKVDFLLMLIEKELLVFDEKYPGYEPYVTIILQPKFMRDKRGEKVFRRREGHQYTLVDKKDLPKPKREVIRKKKIGEIMTIKVNSNEGDINDINPKSISAGIGHKISKPNEVRTARVIKTVEVFDTKHTMTVINQVSNVSGSVRIERTPIDAPGFTFRINEINDPKINKAVNILEKFCNCPEPHKDKMINKVKSVLNDATDMGYDEVKRWMKWKKYKRNILVREKEIIKKNLEDKIKEDNERVAAEGINLNLRELRQQIDHQNYKSKLNDHSDSGSENQDKYIDSNRSDYEND